MMHTVSKTVQATARDPFTQDVIDFFQGRRAGHLSKWLYSVPEYDGDRANGSTEWARVVEEAKNGSAYYVFNDERVVIQEAASIVATHLDVRTRLIDLGPGSADAVQSKIVPILRAAGSGISEYVAVDVSTQSLQIATDTIAQTCKDLQVQTIHQDFIDDHFIYGDPVPCEIAGLFGLTLCNIPIDPRVVELPEMILATELKRLARHFTAKNQYLMITQDANQNVDQLRAAYLAIAPYYRPVLYRMVRDLDIQGAFDPDAFDVEVDFFPETQACAVCFVARHDMMFTIDGEGITLCQNQRFYFHNAYKFSRASFEHIIAQADFQVVETVTVQDNPCVLYLLKAI